ncbi:MAG: AarF/ABC1/UbiB kinase family protein [Syntrophomonas sp.]|uniref:ABC1 kinase family protein n=1 Tax=Syntrophomonas sp. TaxID=2053627 RepID=UPI002607382D|nr:AarF/ABC1/UbiB kinase family protein [Syntrophomonas sp.]MDD3879325.1 AarF/ABC1/UbiB kinase family protein [Syntrophomonas sp.]MDD4626382.1 AarF/ABC1/UbiB kinase family protein [Syntrophomonas sp.]
MNFRTGIGYLQHLPRYREIVNVLIKHGFGFLFDRFDWPAWLHLKKSSELGRELRSPSAAQRLRLALEDLGPTFVKLGQLLSTRPDLLPPEYIKELEKLQNEVPPFSFEEFYHLCQEVGIDLETDFTWFNPEPLAAASIAQVHEALLPSGQKLVLKIKRPGIDKTIEEDLDILRELCKGLEKRNYWARIYRLNEIMEELGQAIHNELDFRVEARNAELFYQTFKNDKNVIIPQVIWDYSSEKILALEYVPGIKISDYISLKQSGLDTVAIARNLVDALFKQIFEQGLLHADPHPGNLAIASGERIIFYDFGQVGIIDERMQGKCIKLLIGMMRYDVEGVSRALLAIGIGGQYVDFEEFRRDVSRLQQKYYGLPLSQIKVGEALSELIELSVRYQLRLPPELSLMVKMLMTVESLVAQLDPQISIVNIAEPYGKKLLLRKFTPENLWKETQSSFLEYLELIRSFPSDIAKILKMLESGQLSLMMEYPELRRAVVKVDVMSNRISLSIILASIVVGTSLVAGMERSSLLNHIPIVEIGFALAIILGLFMVYSILKSGRY